MPALFPAEDSDNDDELIDPPATTPADDFEAKLAELKAKQDAAKEKELAAKKVYKEASDKYEECRAATQDFLDAHAEKLTEKIKAIELESYISLVRDNGKERCDVFSTDELYVDAFNAFGEMFIVYCRGNKLGNYDTPAQVETVIERLKAAIERGDSEFTFPTIEELTTPEIGTATKENNANELPTGKITVKSGTEAWAIVGKHFPKDNLEFCRAGKGFNNEDTFCYTLDEIIYVHVTCTPDNKRVKCIEIVNTYEESESERNILTAYINHDAATESAMEDARAKFVAGQIYRNMDWSTLGPADKVYKIVKRTAKYVYIAMYSEYYGEWVGGDDKKLDRYYIRENSEGEYANYWNGERICAQFNDAELID